MGRTAKNMVLFQKIMFNESILGMSSHHAHLNERFLGLKAVFLLFFYVQRGPSPTTMQQNADQFNPY
jgi:hypothetical protein